MGDRELPAPFSVGISPGDFTFRGMMYFLHFFFERVDSANFGWLVLPFQSCPQWLSFTAFQPFAICVQYRTV